MREARPQAAADQREPAPAGTAGEGAAASPATTPPGLVEQGDSLFAAGVEVGRYRLERLLGAGGMGQVFAARDLLLHRDVAVKVLRGVGLDERALGRFWREARVSGSLRHPNIVAVHDVGTHQGRPYLVLELLEGATLRGLLRERPFDPARASQLAGQLALGLSHAHEHGVLHRDLKPENIFVTADGYLKILDFGIAKLLEPERVDGTLSEDAAAPPSLTRPGSVVGTAGYMSPEQVRSEEIDARSDLFSFGSVLYEMLTGRRAFDAPSHAEVGYAILHGRPAPLPAAIPPGLRLLVAACLQKRPEDRVESAQAIADLLEGKTASLPAPAARFARRGRNAALVLALVVIGAIALLLVRRSTRAGHPEASLIERRAAETAGLPAALAAFQEGERALRGRDVPAARAAFARAAQLDDGFALAHYRAALAASFDDAGAARDSIARALRAQERTTPRERILLRSFSQELSGRLQEAEAGYRELLDASSEDAEANLRLGELLWYTLPYRAAPADAAATLLGKALLLDPDNASPAAALIDIAHSQGQREALRALLGRNLPLFASSNASLEYRWLFAWLKQDQAGKSQLLKEMEAALTASVQAAWLRAAWSDDLEDARAIAGTLIAAADERRRATGWLCLFLTEAAQGRPQAAREAIARGIAILPESTLGQYEATVAALGITPLSPPALADLRARAGKLRLHHIPQVSLLYAAGRLAIAADDQAALESIRRELASLTEVEALPLLADIDRGLRAQQAAKAGGAAAARGLLAQQDLRVWRRYAASFSRLPEQQLRAELLLAEGKPREALRWLQTGQFENPIEPALLAPLLRQAALVQEKLGDKRGALRSYRRFAQRWKSSEPELRGQVEQASRRIQVLEKEVP